MLGCRGIRLASRYLWSEEVNKKLIPRIRENGWLNGWIIRKTKCYKRGWSSEFWSEKI